MARILVAGAALVLAVQLPRLETDDGGRAELVFVILPVAAVVLFLAGLAGASANRRAPWWLSVLAAVGGAVLALFSCPGFVGPPALELAVFASGIVSLLAVGAWVSLDQKRQSRLAAVLTGFGSALAMLVLLRAVLGRYAMYSQSQGLGLYGYFQRAVEATVGFGVGGLLCAVGGAIARTRRGLVS